MKILAIMLSMSLLLVVGCCGSPWPETESSAALSEEDAEDMAASMPNSSKSVSAPSAKEGKRPDREESKRVDAGTAVLDVVNHPAFEGFGQYSFRLAPECPMQA